MINNFSDEIFHGFYKNVHKANCIIIDMLEDDILDLDGNINIETIVNVPIDVLWIYIYYLWKNNNHVETSIFHKMTSGGKASAPLFVEAILDYLKKKGSIDELDYYKNQNIRAVLVNFLSEIIEDKNEWENVEIPILNSIYSKVIAKLNMGAELEGNALGNVGNIGNVGNEKGREINISLVAGIDPENDMIKWTEKIDY